MVMNDGWDRIGFTIVVSESGRGEQGRECLMRWVGVWSLMFDVWP